MTVHADSIERPTISAALSERGRHVFALVILTILAATLTMRTGRLGFMPLDQSIIFDGGWRVLSGQVPLADFYTPTGLVPVLIQGAIFEIAGVSWSAYVFHAAVLNVLFAVLVYAMLRSLFGWSWLALYFALISAYFMYPLMGTPYTDQHALIFTYLTLCLFLWGICSESAWRRSVSWFLMPFAGALAFHSKQIPSGFAILFICCCAAFLLWRDRWRFGRPFLAAIAGSLVVVLLGLAWMASAGVSIQDYVHWTFELPLAHGSARAEAKGHRILVILAMWTASTIPVIVGIHFAFRTDPGLRWRARDLAMVMGMIVLLAGAAIYAVITLNAPIFGFSYYPSALALAYGLYSRPIPEANSEDRRTRRGFQGLFLALGVLAALIAATPVSLRWANEFRADEVKTGVPGTAVHPMLRGLLWSFPDEAASIGIETRASAYRALLDHIARRSGNFLLIGDATILYALSGRPSVFPSLWFHEGLTFPAENDPRRTYFEQRLADALIDNVVAFVVMDGPATWVKTRATDFDVLRSCLSKEDSAIVAIGGFRVVPLSMTCLQAVSERSRRNSGSVPQVGHPAN
ncbi:MAG: hypothetical protein MJE12_25245 [Alphaproteobacteria bacterium]|nr:hypothetical protein [Alphaproteobacteria bacterium]